MRVKICGIRNENDLHTAVDAGVDATGFLVGQEHPSPDFILPSTAARLAGKLPPYVEAVLVTHLTDPHEVMELVNQTGILSIQLHGGSTPEQVVALRDMLPASAKVELAVHFSSENDFVSLLEYYRIVHAFLIDTFDAATGRVGGTGIPNDWNLAAKFAASCPLPVILAGGLNHNNVSEAIRKIHPFAVDANSCMKDPVTRELDPVRCRNFVRTAKMTGMEESGSPNTGNE